MKIAMKSFFPTIGYVSLDLADVVVVSCQVDTARGQQVRVRQQERVPVRPESCSSGLSLRHPEEGKCLLVWLCFCLENII